MLHNYCKLGYYITIILHNESYVVCQNENFSISGNTSGYVPSFSSLFLLLVSA